MADFERALEFVLRPDIEGAFSDDPNDPGGSTNLGISLRFASTVGDLDKDGRLDLDVDGDGDVDVHDIRRLTRHEAEVVYRAMFWISCQCHKMSWPLALQMFDTAINMGRGAAVSVLQTSVGVSVDGKLGPVTMAAVVRCLPRAAAIEFQAARNFRYARLSQFLRYGRGWLRRSAKCLAEALA